MEQKNLAYFTCGNSSILGKHLMASNQACRDKKKKLRGAAIELKNRLLRKIFFFFPPFGLIYYARRPGLKLPCYCVALFTCVEYCPLRHLFWIRFNNFGISHSGLSIYSAGDKSFDWFHKTVFPTSLSRILLQCCL